MQTHTRNTFTTIHTEGVLLPVDLLQRIRSNDASLDGLTPESYHLAPGEKINEAINRSWNRLNGLWGAFQTARSRLGSKDGGTTLTRERWLLPLFQELGFGRLSTSRAVEIEGKSYPISHRWQNVPLHLVGCGLELDKRTPGAAGAARTSPHSLLQEYLNRSEEAQWGLLSNGLGLRILRDNATLTRQAYVEFDLESMFDGEVYSDFVLLWLVCHQSRFETGEKQADCILERWSKNAQERGTRALDDLRRGVEEAIRSLGQGFLLYSLNGELRARLKQGDLSAQDYYRQLLRLVYRLIFLFAAEDRDLLLLPEAPVEARQRYQNFYSTARLRALAERQRGSRHHDRYEALRLVMTLLGSEKGCPELAIPALGGFLFDERSSVDLNDAKLENQSLLAAVRSLAFITEGNNRRAVDYRNLGPEELGSVYESLLELHPLLNTDAGTFELTSAAGNERKTTGSYYTPTSLIKVLLDSALDPVISQAVQNAGPTIENQQSAILNLKVCDPACGSGHFLIAAAHRIARKLAEVRSNGDEPAPQDLRHTLREVIRQCIYGVDINPMAVELCKVNLWLESLEPGKPLSFFDAHIKCGNSLVGVGPGMDLNNLEVPDEAFTPVTGDDKGIASAWKKHNKAEREGQLTLDFFDSQMDEIERWLAENSETITDFPEERVEQVQIKANLYVMLNESPQYRQMKRAADFWTAAFFWNLSSGTTPPTQSWLLRAKSSGLAVVPMDQQVEVLAKQVGFFHWPLEFAEVGAQGGFDCILGNPPWERIKLQEEEFFAQRDPEIATAPNKAARQKLIDQLTKGNPALAMSFEGAKHAAECSSKFIRSSNRYPLTAVGDVNTYALFAELARILMCQDARTGIIVPTGIATDDSTKDFFSNLVINGNLTQITGFENEAFIFPGIHHSTKFCCLTLNSLSNNKRSIDFVFFCRYFGEEKETIRHFNLSASDISIINPNTMTCPVFRTHLDADLTQKIYLRTPILKNDQTKADPWRVVFSRVFDMNKIDVLSRCIKHESSDNPSNKSYQKMLEAKMIHQYDHRYGTYEGATQSNLNVGNLPQPSLMNKINPGFSVLPKYLVEREFIEEKLKIWNAHWLFGYRDITSNIVERTSIAAILPRCGTDYTIRVIFTDEKIQLICCFLANMNSLILDYIVRQKLAGMHLSDYITKQLPILSPNIYVSSDIAYIAPRVLELVYTAFDLKPFAEDMGYYGEPFQWDEVRRALLRSELDAYYARMYGLTRDELRYILDPQDVYGPDFPGETFRVLKEKEIKKFGEYRTRRLVLEAWDRLDGMEIGNPEGYCTQEAQARPPQEMITVKPHEEESQPAVVPAKSQEQAANAPTQPEEQPALADFGLYKCAVCGKMVLGFDKENHEREKHGGKSGEWKKVR